MNHDTDRNRTDRIVFKPSTRRPFTVVARWST